MTMMVVMMMMMMMMIMVQYGRDGINRSALHGGQTAASSQDLKCTTFVHTAVDCRTMQFIAVQSRPKMQCSSKRCTDLQTLNSTTLINVALAQPQKHCNGKQ